MKYSVGWRNVYVLQECYFGVHPLSCEATRDTDTTQYHNGFVSGVRQLFRFLHARKELHDSKECLGRRHYIILVLFQVVRWHHNQCDPYEGTCKMISYSHNTDTVHGDMRAFHIKSYKYYIFYSSYPWFQIAKGRLTIRVNEVSTLRSKIFIS